MGILDFAIGRARPALTGSKGPTGVPLTGPSAPPSRALPMEGGIAAFKSQPGPHQNGPIPNVGTDRIMRFIPPLALYNDASQWVDRKYFVRPMTFNGNPDSNPPLLAQYFTPPPIDNLKKVAAGNLNLQTQLGMLDIQAARLSVQDSNYFGN